MRKACKRKLESEKKKSARPIHTIVEIYEERFVRLKNNPGHILKQQLFFYFT